MSKTTIFIIIGVVVVVVLLLVFSMKKGTPASNDDLSQVAAALKDPGNPKKDCRRACQPICKQYPIISFRGTSRSKCEGRCKSACGQGNDVTKMSFGS